MTQYKYQTDITKLQEGELGMVGGQLVTKDVNGNTVILGNPAGSTGMVDLVGSFAEDAMDISSVKTLGAGFVFLNGTGFDALGVGAYEFQEQDGTTLGLYGRTDGIAQRVFLSAADTALAPQQYTTVPYNPPFLQGSGWHAECVMGGDLTGFVLKIRQDNLTQLDPQRYLYVKHNGTLRDSTQHQYVEISQAVSPYRSFLPSNTTVSILPSIQLVGDILVVGYADFLTSTAQIGISNMSAASVAAGLTQAVITNTQNSLPSSILTVQSQNWPGGELTSGSCPVIMGPDAPGGTHLHSVLNSTTGSVSPVSFTNLVPIVAGWSTNIPLILESVLQDDGSITLFVACGFTMVAQNGDLSLVQVGYTLGVTLSGGSAGAATTATLVYTPPGTGGVDPKIVQSPPFIMSTNFVGLPDETVVADNSIPSSKANKLPVLSSRTGYPQYYSNSGRMDWYYSGIVSMGGTGGSLILRGAQDPKRAQGSLEAARLVKSRQLAPMFNVNPRVDFSPGGAAGMVSAVTTPSGIASSYWGGHMIGQDLALMRAVLPGGGVNKYTVVRFPAGSNIDTAQYNRFGTIVGGMPGRIAEYPTDLPNADASISTWSMSFSNTMADPNNPVNVQFSLLADYVQPNNVPVRVGSWTFDGTTYHAPPEIWKYAPDMTTQLSQVRAAILPKLVAGSGFDAPGQVYGMELIPILNANSDGILFAIGLIYSTDAATQRLNQVTVFMTPCAVQSGVVNLTNTSSVTVIQQHQEPGNGILGTMGGSDLFAGHCYVLNNGTNLWVAFGSAGTLSVVGDGLIIVGGIKFNLSDLSVVSASFGFRSESRNPMSCSFQTKGLGIMAFRDGSATPAAEVTLALYSDSAVASVADLVPSFEAMVANPMNVTPGTTNSPNLKVFCNMQSITGNFILQIGSLQGRLNHKQFSLPSTFIDMTQQAVGHYNLYLQDNGTGIQLVAVPDELPESPTSMFFGSFDRTSTGFANQTSVGEVVRFGTARLVAGSENTPMQGSQIRIGPYVG